MSVWTQVPELPEPACTPTHPRMLVFWHSVLSSLGSCSPSLFHWLSCALRGLQVTSKAWKGFVAEVVVDYTILNTPHHPFMSPLRYENPSLALFLQIMFGHETPKGQESRVHRGPLLALVCSESLGYQTPHHPDWLEINSLAPRAHIWLYKVGSSFWSLPSSIWVVIHLYQVRDCSKQGWDPGCQVTTDWGV